LLLYKYLVAIFAVVQAAVDIVAVAGVAVGLVKCLDRPAADVAVVVVKNPLWRWQLEAPLHPLMMMIQLWVAAAAVRNWPKMLLWHYC
jgi:hypothetical protein